MIAPIQQTDPPQSPAMRRAHGMVASTLLKKQRHAADATPVPAWRAWLFVAWVVAVTAVYAAYMIGLF